MRIFLQNSVFIFDVTSIDFIDKVGDAGEVIDIMSIVFFELVIKLLDEFVSPIRLWFDLGGNAIRRGLLVKLNSLLNASVKMFEIVFSSMFSIKEPNCGELVINYLFGK